LLRTVGFEGVARQRHRHFDHLNIRPFEAGLNLGPATNKPFQ
jgi:hypothetical protein